MRTEREICRILLFIKDSDSATLSNIRSANKLIFRITLKVKKTSQRLSGLRNYYLTIIKFTVSDDSINISIINGCGGRISNRTIVSAINKGDNRFCGVFPYCSFVLIAKSKESTLTNKVSRSWSSTDTIDKYSSANVICLDDTLN